MFQRISDYYGLHLGAIVLGRFVDSCQIWLIELFCVVQRTVKNPLCCLLVVEGEVDLWGLRTMIWGTVHHGCVWSVDPPARLHVLYSL